MKYHYAFKPRIILNAETSVAARNKLLRLLAKAELDGEIVRFDVPFVSEIDRE